MRPPLSHLHNKINDSAQTRANIDYPVKLEQPCIIMKTTLKILSRCGRFNSQASDFGGRFSVRLTAKGLKTGMTV